MKSHAGLVFMTETIKIQAPTFRTHFWNMVVEARRIPCHHRLRAGCFSLVYSDKEELEVLK